MRRHTMKLEPINVRPITSKFVVNPSNCSWMPVPADEIFGSVGTLGSGFHRDSQGNGPEAGKTGPRRGTNGARRWRTRRFRWKNRRSQGT
jgi:hypothetical protein